MPRLAPSLFRQASRISPHAATLLPACRDVPSALNELRWIREHVKANAKGVSVEVEIARLCNLRGRGVPLQYILGNQPFGHLDIKCSPGVLIPRPEPEAYTTHLAGLIRSGVLGNHFQRPPAGELSILDFCTGTGCIAILLYALLQSGFPRLHVRGVDISKAAVSLARANVSHNVQEAHMPAPSAEQDLRFELADIFSEDLTQFSDRSWDIITCNPPYISRQGFAHDTSRSVRNYEPKLAQVPLPRREYEGRSRHEDVFYARLLDIGAMLRPRLMLVEVGDMQQALRVADLAAGHPSRKSQSVEIWRDSPDVSEETEDPLMTPAGHRVQAKGMGHGRCVFISFM